MSDVEVNVPKNTVHPVYTQPPSAHNSLCMQSNINNTTNWALSDEEYKAITSITHQLRLLDGYPWLHKDGPYR